MDIVVYHITGVSSLMMHSPKGMSAAEGPKSIGTKVIPTPEVEAESGAYRLKDGQLYIPTAAFRKAILTAARGRRIGKTSAGMVLGGSVLPAEEEAPLTDPVTNEPLKEYEIDIRRVVLNKQGIRRARPIIRKWACGLPLEVDLEMLPNLEILTEVLNIAGKIVGVLDYRIEKGGIYGRFMAALRNGNSASSARSKKK